MIFHQRHRKVQVTAKNAGKNQRGINASCVSGRRCRWTRTSASTVRNASGDGRRSSRNADAIVLDASPFGLFGRRRRPNLNGVVTSCDPFPCGLLHRLH